MPKKTDVTLDNGKLFGLLQQLFFIILTHNLAFIRWQVANKTAKFYLSGGQSHHNESPAFGSALESRLHQVVQNISHSP